MLLNNPSKRMTAAPIDTPAKRVYVFHWRADSSPRLYAGLDMSIAIMTKQFLISW